MIAWFLVDLGLVRCVDYREQCWQFEFKISSLSLLQYFSLLNFHYVIIVNCVLS